MTDFFWIGFCSGSLVGAILTILWAYWVVSWAHRSGRHRKG